MIRSTASKAMRARTATVFFVILAIILAMTLAGASRAFSTPTIFTVNSTNDTAPGGVCDLAECTLREAINAANANNNSAETDTIAFNIPNEDEPLPHTITTSQALPTITQSVSIDGYTEPDAEPNTLVKSSAGTNAQIAVVLQQGASSSSGLHIQSNNVVVKGLAIHSFGGYGISVAKPGTTFENVRIEGNFIGTNTGGIEDKGNTSNGVNVNQGNNVTVGGDTPAARNLISGNGGSGVFAQSSNDTKVEGNLIGTQKDGKSPLPNGSDGVTLNLGGSGVYGGLTAGSANTIAHNAQRGVLVVGDGSRGTVLRNSIFSNGDAGIKLLPLSTSISSTDHCDTDTGPNGGQNFPIISSVRKDLATGQTTIRVRLNSEPDKTYAVRFFSNPGGTDIEGKTYIGKKSVTTKPSNDPTAPCARTFIYITNKAPGKFVTATATDPNGNTSEFSAPVGVVSQ